MRLHTGGLYGHRKSLHCKLTLGEKSLATEGTRPRVSIAPGLSVGRFANEQLLQLMEVSEAPTPRLKALSKHNAHNERPDGDLSIEQTANMYVEMETVIS